MGSLFIRQGQVLQGRRRGSHRAGSWSAPGDRLEFAQDLLDCARRKLAEAIGLDLGPDTRIGSVTNNVFADVGQH